MRSYARNVSIAASDETLREDCASSDETFDKDVFAKYLNALRKLDIIEPSNQRDVDAKAPASFLLPGYLILLYT